MTKRVRMYAPAFCFTLLLPAALYAQSPVPQLPNAALTFSTSDQQSNVPQQARELEQDVEETVRRFRMGVTGGVGLDPELIVVGAHARFGPLFRPGLTFRPGVEVGLGELTTMLAIDLDVIYTLPGTTARSQWRPYLGAGPNFALSHRGFETDDTDNVDGAEDRNRFDFSDTDFEGGMNFIAGARSRGGLFFELKATAWGVSNIRLLAGFNF